MQVFGHKVMCCVIFLGGFELGVSFVRISVFNIGWFLSFSALPQLLSSQKCGVKALKGDICSIVICVVFYFHII